MDNVRQKNYSKTFKKPSEVLFLQKIVLFVSVDNDYKLCSDKIDNPPQTTFKKCSRCKKVYYCSKECQKRHWPTHKLSCKPV